MPFKLDLTTQTTLKIVFDPLLDTFRKFQFLKIFENFQKIVEMAEKVFGQFFILKLIKLIFKKKCISRFQRGPL